MTRELLVLAAFLAGFVAGRADAQDLPLSFTWTAPPGCPDQAQVEADTRAMIARLPEDAGEHPVDIDVAVGRGPGDAWQAVIHTQSGGVRGERTLRDPSCPALARAVALIVALTLNADLVEAPLEPPAPPPPPAAPPPPPPPAPEPARFASSLVGFGFGLGLGMATGLLPNMAPGAAVHGLLTRGRFGLELRAAAHLPQTRAIDGRPGGEARFVGATWALVACYGSALERRFGAASCAGADLAWVRGKSRGIADPGAASGLWTRALVSAVARMRLSTRGGLRLSLEGARAFRRPVYAVEGAGNVYRPSRYGVGIALGGELYF